MIELGRLDDLARGWHRLSSIRRASRLQVQVGRSSRLSSASRRGAMRPSLTALPEGSRKRPGANRKCRETGSRDLRMNLHVRGIRAWGHLGQPSIFRVSSRRTESESGQSGEETPEYDDRRDARDPFPPFLSWWPLRLLHLRVSTDRSGSLTPGTAARTRTSEAEMRLIPFDGQVVSVSRSRLTSTYQ